MRTKECWINPNPQHPEDWFSNLPKEGWVRFVPAASQALAAQQVPSPSYDELWQAMQDVETWAATLPTFSVVEEGGFEACVSNIIRAIKLAAAPQVPAVPQWLPIETAPKDGSHLILACNGESFIGFWFELPFKEFRDVDGFYVGQQDAEANWLRIADGDQCEPTHWMPLPAAPGAPQPAEQAPLTDEKAWREQMLANALREAQAFIDGVRSDLHHLRATDWFPEGANNAALSMSENMRLIGNACADFDTIGAALAALDADTETLPRWLTEQEVQQIGLDMPAEPQSGYLIRFAYAVLRAAGVKEPT